MKRLVVVRLVHLLQAGLERDEVVLGQPGRREPGRDRLEDPANLVHLEQRLPLEQVADEAHAGEQHVGVEARDVGPVADAGVEHADQR